MKSPHPAQKASQKRPWLFTALVGACVLAYVFAMFLPSRRATAAIRQEMEKQRTFIMAHSTDTAKIAAAERELAATIKFIETWRASAPHEARLAQVFGEITRDADETGVQIVRFEPQPVEHLERLQRIPVQMALEGSFDQIFAFLRQVEAIDVDFWITTLQVEPVTAGSPRLRCELHLAFFAGRREISD